LPPLLRPGDMGSTVCSDMKPRELRQLERLGQPEPPSSRKLERAVHGARHDICCDEQAVVLLRLAGARLEFLRFAAVVCPWHPGTSRIPLCAVRVGAACQGGGHLAGALDEDG
jgi:hypothetical protein